MRRRWAALAALVVLPGLCVQGCGYQFYAEGPGPRIGSGSGPAVMDDAESAVWLAVRTVRNRTFHRNLEAIYTSALRQEFAVGGGAHVVADDAQAEYVMAGEIVSVSVSPLTFSTSATRERRVTASVRATVTHRRTGDVAWTETATGAGDFFVNRVPDVATRQDEIQFNQALQDRALERAGYDAAEMLAASFAEARRQGRFASGPSAPPAASPTPPAPGDPASPVTAPANPVPESGR